MMENYIAILIWVVLLADAPARLSLISRILHVRAMLKYLAFAPFLLLVLGMLFSVLITHRLSFVLALSYLVTLTFSLSTGILLDPYIRNVLPRSTEKTT